MKPRHFFSARPGSQRPHRSARRQDVDVPHGSEADSAIYLAMRRMRTPIVVVLVAFSFAVVGLSLMPGVDPEGNPYRLSLFEAFYVISYTATTIGYGEVPYAFSVAQRMWVTASIYLTVVTWAYGLGALLSLMQEEGFKDAIAARRFRRQVRRLPEQFLIVCGYGHAGASVGRGLDEAGIAFVAIDTDQRHVQDLSATSQLMQDVPGLEGDAAQPDILGIAGLGHPDCAGVLALTDDDTANLGIVMAANLLRPELPVIARCQDRETEAHMHAFGVDEVINPHDRYGAYLLLSLQRPHTHRLLTWLLSPPGSPLPDLDENRVPSQGAWVVMGTGDCPDELVNDLLAAELEVRREEPSRSLPVLDGAVAFIAATDDDILNLALAENARLERDDLFVGIRQHSSSRLALAEALQVDNVYVATELVARDVLARVVTPNFRSFIDEVLEQDNAWARRLVELLRDRVGEANPVRDVLEIDADNAPAVTRWLTRGGVFTVQDLLRDPDDRDTTLHMVALMVMRADGARVVLPEPELELQLGDRVLLAGTEAAQSDLTETLYYDSSLIYAVTGEHLPVTWVWRLLTGRSRDSALR